MKKNISTLLSILSIVAIVAIAQPYKVVQIFRGGEVIQEYDISDIDYIEVNEKLACPANIQATVNDGVITVTWSEVEDATYNIYRSADDNEYTLLAEGLIETKYIDKNPYEGDNYYKVKALINNLESEYSSSILANYPDTEIYKTVEEVSQGVLGICHRMEFPLSSEFIGNQDMACGENGILAYYGELTGTDCYYNRFNEYGSGNPSFYDMTGTNLQNYYCAGIMWQYCYSKLEEVNDIINNIDEAVGDESEKQFRRGQAYTMRAHYYFRLLQVYGPRWKDSREGAYKCLVLRTGHEPADSPLVPMKTILALCYSDLDVAIESFKKAGSYQRSLPYEPTLNVAYGVYARVAALKHDWEKVREMAHNARQGYKLATEKEMFGGYCEFNNNEWLWSASFLLPDDNHIFGNWCVSFAANSYRARLQGASMRISRDLYNRIPDNDIRRNLWFTVDKLNKPIERFYNSSFVSPTNQNIINAQLRTQVYNWLEAHTPEGFSDAYLPEEGMTASNIADGIHVKFFAKGLTGEEGGCKPPYMRATEMWLYEAEAIAQLAKEGKASYADAQKLLEEINNIPTGGEYKCTLTGDELLEEIYLYRRIELWGEGFCWFDMKRWSKPLQRTAWVEGDVTSGNLPANICSEVIQPSDKNGWVYAFPLSECKNNTAVAYPFDPFAGE